VWWISNIGSIFTCPLAGCAIPKLVLLTKEGALTSIAVDVTYVYYTFFGTAANAYADGNVVRVEKTGANPTPLASNQHKPGGLIVDATDVYWSETENPGAVNRCAIAGCGGTPTPIATGHAMPSATAVDGATVYWNDQMTGEIWKHDATSTAPILSGRGTVLSTALDATSLYFAQFDAAGKIVRVSKSGANVVELATSQTYPESVAIDDTRVYWTTLTSVWSADKDTGTNPRVVLSASSPALPKSLRVDAASVVWCENGGNRIVRVAK
jgi:hypothetical protein